AMLGSLCLPFVFREFDAEAEKISIKILRGLGRFDIGSQLPEKAITEVILNEGLRNRLKTEHSEEQEIQLIRDALVEQMKAEVKNAAQREQHFQEQIRQTKATLQTLDAEKQATDADIKSLKLVLAEGEVKLQSQDELIKNQGAQLDTLKGRLDKN